LIAKPAGEEEKTPAELITVGCGLIPVWQYVADEYVKEASSFGFTVIVTLIGALGQPLIEGN
jgi:hypothetical protein